ncbi:hypothetical protein FJT64_020322 [Amphibalanus amphitrite]|uniref:Uncharacterized protein n=1 Tax=Amphibalanus amphitrite TaxID=1232801 RepID=A0A6A4WXM7_AMPAM|nr:hypothetical protein FJT64_020322 [Amphibalanus amphitrite]
MIPAQTHTPSPLEPGLPPGSLPLTPDELERRQFYNTYNAWTGINIAASLGGFFMLLILLLLYKSKCKRRSKYPPCPSVEDGDVSLLEPWDVTFLGGSVADGLSLGSGRHPHSSDSTPAGTVRGSRHSLAGGRGSRQSLAGGRGSRQSLVGSRKCVCSAPGSVQRLPRRPRLSSGGSSEAGHQLELRVHHPKRRGPPRYAYSFDEKAVVPESWWQRVDINVIQPTPSVTPSASLHCLASSDQEADGAAPAPPLTVPRLDLPRPRRGSAVSSSDLTDFDARSIGSDSVFLADDDWSSCSEAASPSRGRRRWPLSRQASVCLEDDLIPELKEAPLPPPRSPPRTELLYVPGMEPGLLRAARPDGGGAPRPSSPQFLTVPSVHGAPRSPPARRSPNFLSPPSPTYGPARSMSPPPPATVSPAGRTRRLGVVGRQPSICQSVSLSSSSSSSTASLHPASEPAAPPSGEEARLVVEATAEGGAKEAGAGAETAPRTVSESSLVTPATERSTCESLLSHNGRAT